MGLVPRSRSPHRQYSNGSPPPHHPPRIMSSLSTVSSHTNGATTVLMLPPAQCPLVSTIMVEGIGALVGVFHSVKAFNHADFDLTGGFRSTVLSQDAPFVLLLLSVLTTFGGRSYLVIKDAVHRRQLPRLTFDSKLVPVVFLGLLPVAALGATMRRFVTSSVPHAIVPAAPPA